MPNLQYIGARYVPTVYSNPDDSSSNWKSGVPYENLVIVTYQGDSYTSRKPVPSSIGNPASNPAYWAKTGDFNAALTTLQNEISDINNVKIPAINSNIDALNVKCGLNRVIFIGDSYGTASYGNWAEQMANLMHIDSAHRYINCEYGNGFKNDNQMPNNNGFLRQLQTTINAMNSTEKSEVSHVFIMGGFNDWTPGTGAEAINNGLRDCANFIRSNCPNAEIYVAFIATIISGVYTGNATHDYLVYTEYAYQNACLYRNVHYMSNVKYGLMLPITPALVGSNGLFESDGMHPNVNGGLMIAQQAVLDFYGSSEAFRLDVKSSTLTFTFTDNSTLDVPIKYRIAGNELHVEIDWAYISTLNIAISNVSELQIAVANLPRSVFFNRYHQFELGTIGRFTTAGGKPVTLEFVLTKEQIKLQLLTDVTNDTLFALAVQRAEFVFDLYDK